MQTMSDRLFTAWVNWVQGNIVPLGVRMRMRRRRRNVGAPPEEFARRLKQLGIDAERIWWGPMTLFPRKAAFLIDAIEANPPTAVLEVGSGSSTPLLAALAAKHGFAVVSLENHRGSYDYVRSLLDTTPGGERVKLENRGFVRRRYPDGRRYRWYDIDLASYGLKFDFVLVDGPMGTLVGRNGALPEIAGHLASYHNIYLDDAQRDHERACIREWQGYYPTLNVEEFEACPGLARLRLGDLR